MSSFADFALLASIPSYGGAEILRAQRILPSSGPGGAGPRVHLALFGRSDAIARRVVDVAVAAANVEHPALARILEVGRFDGIVYGVAEPAEGVDVASLLVSDKARKRTPPVELGLGIATAVARLIVALHETGDTWAPQLPSSGAHGEGAAVGLTSVFPAGLGPETLFLEPGGAVRLRVIAAAAGDARAPSPFRAPDPRPSQSGDVYALGRLLMALLAGDPTGQETPRLASGSPILRLLPRLLEARAEDRPDLHDVVERLEQALAALGTTPEQAVQQALAGTYRGLVVDAASGFVPAPRIIDEIRARLPEVRANVQRLFPAASSAPLATPFAALPPAASDEGAAVFTDARPAAGSKPRRGKTASTLVIDDLKALAIAAQVAEAAPPAEAPSGFRAAGRVTSPTLIIPNVELLKRALPPGAPAPDLSAEGEGGFEDRREKTQLIDPNNFVPFAPPPPPGPPPPSRNGRPPPPPPPSTSSSSSSSSPGASFGSSPSTGAARGAPPPHPSELSGSMRRPIGAAPGNPHGATASGPVFASASATVEAGSGPFRTASEHRTEHPTTAGRRKPGGSDADPPPGDRQAVDRGPPPHSFVSLRSRTPSTQAPTRPPPPPTFDVDVDSDRAPATVPPELADVFASELSSRDDDEHTVMAAPIAAPSLPGPDTAKQPQRAQTDMANAPTRLPGGRGGPPLLSADQSASGFAASRPQPPSPMSDGLFDGDFDDQGGFADGPVDSDHTALVSNVPDLSNAGSGDDPVDLDDGGAFQMVGDAGRTFGEDDNPFAQHTRMIPAQALQMARSNSDEAQSEQEPDEERADPDGATEMFTAERMKQMLDAPSQQQASQPTGRAEPAPVSQLSGSPSGPGAGDPAPPVSQRGQTLLSGEGPPTSRTAEPTTTPAQRRADFPTPPHSAGAIDQVGHVLIIEAPDGANVAINGTVVGSGKVTVDVDANARAVVRVTMAGFTPWSSVVQVQGRPRVRVRPTLVPKK